MRRLPFAEGPPIVVDHLDVPSFRAGVVHRIRVELMRDGAGNRMSVPVLLARSDEPGPVVGITAAVHGNELNGIPVAQRIFRSEPVSFLQKGAIVAVPIVNGPGFLNNSRDFLDGKDLNRTFPGRPNGPSADIYAHRFMNRVVRSFDFLLDLHTASFGRVNSFYIRADMTSAMAAKLARLIRPQIIVHNKRGDGTLRAAASDLGIHAITIEVGDPQRFQRGLVRSSRLGIQEVLEHLQMIPDMEDPPQGESVECQASYWMYTQEGGILEVFPHLAERVAKGQRIARLVDVWGEIAKEYHAPEDGVVIGKSSNPVAWAGSRILHLGLLGNVA